MSAGAVASGLSYGMAAQPGHAAAAVRAALERAGLERAESVLLLLTTEYADDPGPALRAAARAAGCTQIVGCTGLGLLTEQEWVLDSPGAAALVLGGRVALRPVRGEAPAGTVLSLCTPQGLDAAWLDRPWPRIGAVAANVAGRGAHAAWSAARASTAGRVEALLDGVQCDVVVSQGIRPLTPPIEIAAVDGFDLLRMDGQPALKVLAESLPGSPSPEPGAIPLHALGAAVTYGDPATAIGAGRYRLSPVVAADYDCLSVTLADRLQAGERVFWAMRDAAASEREMSGLLEQAVGAGRCRPDFGLMFACASRGPAFYGNRERDIEAFRDRLPGVPLAGLYGNSAIGALAGSNHLFQHATVVGLCRAHAA